jgi:small conductance mechanosensitive channel
VLGVEKVDSAARAITMRVLVKTAPLEQWNVSRELGQRLVGAFKEAGIEIPPWAGFVVPEKS